MDPIGAEKGVVFFFVIIFVAPRGPTYDATNYWRELTKVQFTRAHQTRDHYHTQATLR